MNQLGFRAVGRNGGNGLDFGVTHDDGVTLHMTEALGIAGHLGIENLHGCILSNTSGYNSALAVLTVENDFHIALGKLLTMGLEALGDNGFRAGAAGDDSVALGGVNALYLGGVHFEECALFKIHNGLGVHYLLAVAVTLAVVLFDILDIRNYGIL